jgi:hypothetical protein
LKNSKGKQVFTDSDLALAGKLKLIFEREKMTWFEIREEKSKTPFKNERFFALYYYPHRFFPRPVPRPGSRRPAWKPPPYRPGPVPAPRRIPGCAG